jgi:hypothetical protein
MSDDDLSSADPFGQIADEFVEAVRQGKRPSVEEPVWGGTWARGHKAAEMLRLDLEAAGIPYAVEGPDGPEFADFHSLRHSYLGLGGRAGIGLRTLQELAGHSTPVLTARYMHPRLHDLAGAVDKLPSVPPDQGGKNETAALAATGTDGQLPPAEVSGLRSACASGGSGRERLAVVGSETAEDPGNGISPESPATQGFGADRERLEAGERRVGDRTRTGDILIHSPILANGKPYSALRCGSAWELVSPG